MREEIIGITHLSWSKALATFAVFQFLGPPIAAILFCVGTVIFDPSSFYSPTSVGQNFDFVLFVFLTAIPFSFVFGGIQAFMSGVVFAAIGLWERRLPTWVVLVVGSLFLLLMLKSYSLHGQKIFFGDVPMYLLHFLPVLACWLISRKFWTATAE